MRLICCGKPVTGIGNVPKWDPPRRKKITKKKEEEKDLKVVIDEGDEDKEADEKDNEGSDENLEASAPPKFLDE